MDFKDMSFKELIEIRETLNKEIEDRKIHKSSIYDPKISSEFAKKWGEKGLGEWEIGDNLNKFYSSVYRICDFTLENYKLEPKKISVNGKRIDIENPDIYVNMANDVFDVVKKYL